MDVFEKVKKLCKDRGISVARMERESGLGERSTYNWKKTKPSYASLKMVADYLGIPVDALVSDKDDKDSKGNSGILEFQRPCDNFYEIISALCAERGISVTAFGAAIGVSSASVSDWKNKGATPRNSTLKKASDFFGVSIEYLNGTSDQRTPYTGAPGAPTEDDLKVALFGGDGEVTDEMWEEAKRYAQYLKERRRDGE